MAIPVKPDTLRAMTDADLHQQLDALRDELYHLRYKMHVEEVENPGAKTILRRNIARTMTILREKELEAEAAEKEETNE